MSLHLRPAVLTTVAGAAWLLAATFARADSAPTEVAASAPGPVPGDAALQLAAPAALTFEGADTSGAARPNDLANVQIPAVPPVDPDRWSVTVVPYVWFASVKSDTSFSPSRSTETIDANVDASFIDLLKGLNFGIMGAAEARRGRFSVQTDLLYMDLSQTGSRVRSVTGPFGRREAPFDLGGKVSLKTTVWTLSAGYDVFRDDRSFVQLFGGFRYLGIRTTLDWSFQGPLADLPRTGSVSASPDIWDGIAGIRGERALGEGRWKVIYYGDVGGGASKLTWQASAQLAYAQRWGDIGFGWRYLDYEQEKGKVSQGLRMSGPILTMHYRFGG
jgi:hypothetical protein